MMNYVYDDGGRAGAGYKGTATDCAVRSMSIALQIPYKQAYDELAEANKRLTGKRSARNGIFKETMTEVLAAHGFTWRPAPKFEGRKARCHDMPSGRVIARQAHHFVAVVDQVPHDTFDPTEKMVYGYYSNIEAIS